MRKATIAVAGISVAALLATAGGAAQASGWITGAQIKDSTVTGVDVKNGSLTGADIADRSLGLVDISPAARTALHGATGAKGATGAAGATGPQGPAGAPGAPGQDGKDGKDGVNPMLGAYYAVAFYDVGDTNAGAIATVGCKAQTDIAISGGVQVLGIGGTQAEVDAANARNTPVSSSFPGRMDWSTNTPKANRLDGWIVQFGGNAGTVSDKAPEKVKVYALCVPNLTVPVETTYTQSG